MADTFGVHQGRPNDISSSLQSWEVGMQVRKQQLELDMEQQTSSK